MWIIIINNQDKYQFSKTNFKSLSAVLSHVLTATTSKYIPIDDEGLDVFKKT